ncbi:MAG: serine/threonine-protein kinase [Sandaracinaceae bacterium]
MGDRATLTPGTVLDGAYRIEGRLGGGGMGSVYVAEQLTTGRKRALKVMHPELLDDEKSRQRFEEEARVAAAISSEHVVEVIGAGFDEAEQVPYLAMELLEGEDLSARLKREGALPLAEVKEILLQTGHALAAAHAQGVVHRDLKPENLFIAESHRRNGVPMVKVLDFGIAKTLDQSRSAITATSAVGSPLFMAPEQATPGSHLRAATDVWSIGLIAFRALTGHHYWRSPKLEVGGLQSLLAEVLVHPLPSASERARHFKSEVTFPAGFDAWFAACVVREPELRFAEAGACVASLERVLDGLGTDGLAPTLSASGEGLDTGPTGSPPFPLTSTPPEPSSPARGASSGRVPSASGSVPSRSGGMSVLLIVGSAIGVVVLIVTMGLGIFVSDRWHANQRAAARPAANASAPKGIVTIESSEQSAVYLNGRLLGETPIVARQLPVGQHEFVFTTRDGRRVGRLVQVHQGVMRIEQDIPVR